MQFFEGKGYSDEFVCGMAKIVSVLENNNANLTLTGGCDEICSSCPNRDNGSCDVTGKASCYDKRCLDLLGMKIGDTADWKELSNCKGKYNFKRQAFAGVRRLQMVAYMP